MNPHNALASSHRAEPLFPEGHPLRALVQPSFDSIRGSMRGMYVSTIWVDSAVDPSRAGFRPSYDDVYGAGSANVMPFVATWLSTGPGSEDGGNVVLMPEGIDRTLVAYMTRVGLLGPHRFVPSVPALKDFVRKDGRKSYNIDDFGEDFDDCARVGSALSHWLNSKERLDTITRFHPIEHVKDMYDATRADFDAVRGSGSRVFLKTCNTESAGAGVYIAKSADEFEAQLGLIRNKQVEFALSRTLVLQPEIRGANKSFQVLLDPSAPEEIQVVALTDQLVEADGKTYRSSINHPITAETVAPIGPAILDMVEHVRARHPEAFGFMMSDYFDTAEGPVLYDPGIRPTGNTATALALHFARKLTGRFLTTSLIPIREGRAGTTFGDFAGRAGRLVEPENIVREGRALMPWGWNHLQGTGMIIAIAESPEALVELEADARRFAD